MGLSSIRDLLSGSAFNKAGVRRSISASMIVEAANRVLPGYLPGMQAHEVVAISFKDGVLHLRLKNAAARHALKGVEQQLQNKLRELFPTSTISRIRTFVSKEPSRYELP